MDVTGCSESPLEAYECLQAVPWEDLVESLTFRAAGTLDNTRSDNPVVPDRPEILLSSGDFNQVRIYLQ